MRFNYQHNGCAGLPASVSHRVAPKHPGEMLHCGATAHAINDTRTLAEDGQAGQASQASQAAAVRTKALLRCLRKAPWREQLSLIHRTSLPCVCRHVAVEGGMLHVVPPSLVLPRVCVCVVTLLFSRQNPISLVLSLHLAPRSRHVALPNFNATAPDRPRLRRKWVATAAGANSRGACARIL